MEGGQEEDEEMADEQEQKQRQQPPLPQQQPVASCHAAKAMGSKAPYPHCGDLKRSRAGWYIRSAAAATAAAATAGAAADREGKGELFVIWQ